jgi:hypothetical protein
MPRDYDSAPLLDLLDEGGKIGLRLEHAHVFDHMRNIAVLARLV